MILRRLSEHLRAQNWMAVALDSAIVVTGVFIGIQVSNWNDVRREHALEQQYPERLSIDIQLSVQRAEMNIDSHEQQIAYVDSRAVREIPTDGPFSMSDLSPDMVSFDFPGLCEDPRYASAVSTIRFTTAVTLSHHRQMLER